MDLKFALETKHSPLIKTLEKSLKVKPKSLKWHANELKRWEKDTR